MGSKLVVSFMVFSVFSCKTAKNDREVQNAVNPTIVYDQKLELIGLDENWKNQMKTAGKEVLEKIYTVDANELKTMTMADLVNRLGANNFYGDFVVPKLPPPSYAYTMIYGNYNPLDGMSTQEKVQKNLMAGIASIMWAMTGDLKTSESVAFNIRDNEEKLTIFLKKYTAYTMNGNTEPASVDDYLKEKYEESIKRSGLGVQKWYSIGTNSAYPRNPHGGASTHLGNVESIQFGLDFRERDGYFNGQLLDMLPSERTHIIWGEVTIPGNEKRLYIKPEKTGIGTAYDMVLHGADFIQSLQGSEDYKGEKITKNKEMVKRLSAVGVSKEDIEKKPLFQILKEVESNQSISADKKDSLNAWLLDEFKSEDFTTRLGNEVLLDNSSMTTEQKATFILDSQIYRSSYIGEPSLSHSEKGSPMNVSPTESPKAASPVNLPTTPPKRPANPTPTTPPDRLKTIPKIPFK